MSRSSFRLSGWVRFFIALLVVVVVLLSIDVGLAVELFRDIQWHLVLWGLVAVQGQILLSAIRWQRTVCRMGQRMPLSQAVSEYYIASFLNLSLPGGVSGDGVRVYRNRSGGGLSASAHAVMLERLSGQLVLATVTMAGWGIVAHELPLALAISPLILLSVPVLLALLFVSHPLAVKVRRFFIELAQVARRVWMSDNEWCVQLLLSICVVFSYLLVFALCAQSLGSPLTVVETIGVVPVILLSMIIPVSVGGWGVRESAAALLWPLLGMAAEAGVASSILYGLVSMTGALPGLYFLLKGRRTVEA